MHLCQKIEKTQSTVLSLLLLKKTTPSNKCSPSWILGKHRADCCLLHAHLLSRQSIAWRLPAHETIQIHASSERGRGCVVAQADHPRLCGPHLAGEWLDPKAYLNSWQNLSFVLFFCRLCMYVCAYLSTLFFIFIIIRSMFQHMLKVKYLKLQYVFEEKKNEMKS